MRDATPLDGAQKECCGTPTKRTMYGNFRCLACKRIYSPVGKVVFKPRHAAP